MHLATRNAFFLHLLSQQLICWGLSIKDVRSQERKGIMQCEHFAILGGWREEGGGGGYSRGHILEKRGGGGGIFFAILCGRFLWAALIVLIDKAAA